MSSNNRRRGPSTRPPYLREAPPPPADDPAREQRSTATLTGEDAPWAPGQQVSIICPASEYMELLEKADADSWSPLSGLLKVTDEDASERTDDEDAAFEPPTPDPPAARQQLADVDLGDVPPPASNEPTPPREESPAGRPPASSSAPPYPDDAPDPFEELARASSTPRAWTLGAPGSASIDTAPVTRVQRRTRRTTTDTNNGDQLQRTASRLRLGYIGFLMTTLVVSGAIVFAVIHEQSTPTPRITSRGAAASVPKPALPVLAQPFASIAHEIITISRRIDASSARRRRRLRNSSARHPGTHARRPHRSSVAASRSSSATATPAAAAAPPAPAASQSTPAVHYTPPAPAAQPSTYTHQQTGGPTSLGSQVGTGCSPTCH